MAKVYEFPGDCVMNNKWGILAVFVLLISLMSPKLNAVSTTEINRVRNKPVLEGRDFDVIDAFVAEAVGELVNTEDFSNVAKSRIVILQYKRSSESSAEEQYAESFFESAYKYISSGLLKAEYSESKLRRFKIIINLLILIDGFEEPRFADLAIDKLNDESSVIQYWAVHCLTNRGITDKLKNPNSPNNRELADKIAISLAGLVYDVGSETLSLITNFASALDTSQSRQLLWKIADMRISQYADWSVKNELVDAAVLRALSTKMSNSNSDRIESCRRFCQLFSYAIQRYVKGRDYLNDDQKHQLVSVLADTERKCIGELLKRPQSIIRRAAGAGDYNTIMNEHDRLLGAKTKSGELLEKFKFNYGKNGDGRVRTLPLELPAPPPIEVAK